MSEHRQSFRPEEFYGQGDATQRISREMIENSEGKADKVSLPLIQGESRTFLPPQKGVEERTSFRMTERKMSDGNEPIPFEMHVDDEGKWVIETPMLAGETWSPPTGTEYTFTRAGLFVRPAEDVERGIPAVGPLPAPSNSLVMQMMLQQVRNAAYDQPALTILTHESQSGQGDLLSMTNSGNSLAKTETASRVIPAPVEADSSMTDETVIIPVEQINKPLDYPEVVPVELQDADRAENEPTAPAVEHTEEVADMPERTQSVDMSEFLAEGREGTVDSTVIAEEKESAGLSPVEAEPENEPEVKEDPLEGIASQFRTAVRLGSMTREEALAATAMEEAADTTEYQDAKEREHFVLDTQLSLSEAVGRVLDYAGEQMNAGDKAIEELLRDPEIGLVERLKRASTAGESIQGSGILTTISDLKAKFGEYSNQLDDLGVQVRAYLESDEHDGGARNIPESMSEQEREFYKTRSDATEAMGKLGDAFGRAKTANDSVQEFLRSLETDLTNNVPVDKLYDPSTGAFNGGVENPDMVVIREALSHAMERMGNMAQFIRGDRQSALNEVKGLLAELDTLRDKMKTQAQS